MRILAAAALALAAPAAAQDPKFAYGKADSAPAPPAGAAWEAGYLPLAEKLDTFAELVLVHELL